MKEENPNRAVGDRTVRVTAEKRKLISPNPVASIGAPRVKIEREGKTKTAPKPSAAAALLLLFCLMIASAGAAIISPPVAGDSGGYYPTRLLWNLAGSTSTNRIYYTNAGSYFGNTNTSQLNIRTNGSGRWEWRSGSTVLATNTANKQFGVWRTNGAGAAVYGYTRYEPTQTDYVRVDALGAIVSPANFGAVNNLGFATNLIWVSKNGSDTTGTGTYQSPFATPSNAVAQAVSGQTIVVAPGLYTNQNNLLKNGVNWRGEPGANLLYIQTTTNDAGYGILDDRDAAYIGRIDWPGEITLIGCTNVAAFYDAVEDSGLFPVNANTLGTIVLTNPASRLVGRFGRVSGSAISTVGQMNVLHLAHGNHEIYADAITNVLYGSTWEAGIGTFLAANTGVFTGKGNATVHSPYISGNTYGWLWLTGTDTAASGDADIFCDRLWGQTYGDVNADNVRGWLRANEIDASYAGATSTGVGIGCYGGGKWYFDVLKVRARDGAVVLQTAAGLVKSNVQVWVTSQKLSTTAGFIASGAGKIDVTATDWEHTGSGVLNGITTSGNGVVIPHYSVSGLTNIAASATSLVVSLVPPMPGTNYTPIVSLGFNPVAVISVGSLTRSNFTITASTGVTTGGAVRWEAKQNIQ